MPDRVVYLSDSDTYHRPKRGWRSSRCGLVGISDWKIEKGTLVIEDREDAEAAGKEPCGRCFKNERRRESRDA